MINEKIKGFPRHLLSLPSPSALIKRGARDLNFLFPFPFSFFFQRQILSINSSQMTAVIWQTLFIALLIAPHLQYMYKVSRFAIMSVPSLSERMFQWMKWQINHYLSISKYLRPTRPYPALVPQRRHPRTALSSHAKCPRQTSVCIPEVNHWGRHCVCFRVHSSSKLILTRPFFLSDVGPTSAITLE